MDSHGDGHDSAGLECTVILLVVVCLNGVLN